MLKVKLDNNVNKENEEAVKAIVDKFNDMLGNIGKCTDKSLNEIELFVSEHMYELRQDLLELHASVPASTNQTEPKSLEKNGDQHLSEQNSE